MLREGVRGELHMKVRRSCRGVLAIGCLVPMIVLLAGPQAKAATRFKTFYLPRCCTFPWGITAGPDGNIWFTENDPSPGTGNNIGRLTPTGTLTEFPIPTGQSCPEGITDGPDGNLWFVETCKDQIGRVTPTGGFTEFRVPQIEAFLLDIATGPDGNLWFTENYGNKIGRITPDGVVTEFYAAGSLPAGITAGPD